MKLGYENTNPLHPPLLQTLPAPPPPGPSAPAAPLCLGPRCPRGAWAGPPGAGPGLALGPRGGQGGEGPGSRGAAGRRAEEVWWRITVSYVCSMCYYLMIRDINKTITISCMFFWCLMQLPRFCRVERKGWCW